MRVSIYAILSALALALFIGVFTTGVTVSKAPTVASSSGLSTIPAPPPLVINLPTIVASTSSASASAATPVKKSTATSTKAVVKNTPIVITPPVVVVPQPPQGDINAAAATIRGALVNILCYANAGSGISSISGSGVVISPKGIILTNAHIGQYFLLANKGVSCVIRTGSPAVAAYTAQLIFISPQWVSANAAVITEANPTGTGQYDFALLAVTNSTTGVGLPLSFPFVPLEENDPIPGEPVVIGSYAAQFLGSSQIQSSLYPTVVFDTIKNIYTFGVNTVDVISLGGSAAAQEGSSGGGALDAAGELTATITTSTSESDTANRTLTAITATYIRRDYATEIGSSLDSLLAQPTDISIADFASRIAGLEAEIVAALAH